ncbi:MAG: HVO_0476 family zinc finger protein, partial [Candidatus Thermoplasmatota archaeon]|nr:HVO_0476 family zinc finger protein [Candidatus Thermoplasmatota archaeon]
MSDQDEGVFSECPICVEVTDHSIIKRTPQGEGEDVLVMCSTCSFVQKIMIRPPKPVMVNTTLSDGRESFGVEIEVDEDEEISVGDMFEHDEITWMVTRIDNNDSRPEKALV